MQPALNLLDEQALQGDGSVPGNTGPGGMVPPGAGAAGNPGRPGIGIGGEFGLGIGNAPG